MSESLSSSELGQLAPCGYHIALHIGFAFPLSEINAWPRGWIEHYTRQRLVMRDPVIRWVYASTGAVRWSAIVDPDPDQVLQQAAAFGLRFGAAIACRDGESSARSFGIFARPEREFEDQELARLEAHLLALHAERAPPDNLTKAELEALGLIRSGMRQKQIAHEIGITEGAVKLRLRNAKRKLGAQTAAQAAALAREHGLV